MNQITNKPNTNNRDNNRGMNGSVHLIINDRLAPIDHVKSVARHQLLDSIAPPFFNIRFFFKLH